MTPDEIRAKYDAFLNGQESLVDVAKRAPAAPKPAAAHASAPKLPKAEPVVLDEPPKFGRSPPLADETPGTETAPNPDLVLPDSAEGRRVQTGEGLANQSKGGLMGKIQTSLTREYTPEELKRMQDAMAERGMR